MPQILARNRPCSDVVFFRRGRFVRGGVQNAFVEICPIALLTGQTAIELIRIAIFHNIPRECAGDVVESEIFGGMVIE